MRTTGRHRMGSLRKGSPPYAIFVTELIIHQFWGARDRSGQAYGEPARGPTRRSHPWAAPAPRPRVGVGPFVDLGWGGYSAATARTTAIEAQISAETAKAPTMLRF